MWITGFIWELYLEDGSKGIEIQGTPGGASAAGRQGPTGSPIPAATPPFSAPNNGAIGGAGGGGGGLRFTSTSQSLGDAFGGGGGAGPGSSGAPGFIIAFKLQGTAV